ncbi:MAG TPA: ABC transporter substrate-binding protein [Burkholderiaceae bacterium]|jgi:polar amino acid transport system substrate-binding protein|nr:ABC transporter substrate-binding protein [Burkholderiaceae bacterium]
MNHIVNKPGWFALAVQIVACIMLILFSASTVAAVKSAAREGAEPAYIASAHQGVTIVDGICVDFMRAIEEIAPEIAFDLAPELQPALRVETAVAYNQIDIACGFLRNAEEERKVNYIEPALFSMGYSLLVRTSDDVQIKDWNEIANLGDEGVILVNPDSELISRLKEVGGLKVDFGGRNWVTNLQKLLVGRGRFYLHQTPGFDTTLAKSEFNGKVKTLPMMIKRENFYMISSKFLPENVRERIGAAIVEIDRSGLKQRILDKWNIQR